MPTELHKQIAKSAVATHELVCGQMIYECLRVAGFRIFDIEHAPVYFIRAAHEDDCRFGQREHVRFGRRSALAQQDIRGFVDAPVLDSQHSQVCTFLVRAENLI